jgi:hypothetical protein
VWDGAAWVDMPAAGVAVASPANTLSNIPHGAVAGPIAIVRIGNDTGGLLGASWNSSTLYIDDLVIKTVQA